MSHRRMDDQWRETTSERNARLRDRRLERTKFADPRDTAVALAPPLRQCNGCGYWHSKPCGEGCVLSPCDPTFEEVSARVHAAIDNMPPGRSTMTGGFACPNCGGTTHERLRCTGCGFSPLDERPDHDDVDD